MGDLAASSPLRVGVAGSLRSQESLVLAAPSSVASSVSQSVIVGHALARLGGLPRPAPALHGLLPREVEILVKSVVMPVRSLGVT